MQINVLLPTGTQTVDLDELKELARQGVVQPSTLLETGGRRGKAKNVPALKPIFAELAAQTPTPEPSSFPPIPTPSEPPRTSKSPNVPSIPTPPEPLVSPSTPTPPEPPVFSPISTPPEPPQFDAPSTFPDFSTFETPQPAASFDDVYGLEDSAAPNAFATETPSPEDAPSDDAASSADDSNSPFYFDARSPIPLPKRFRKSNKGFYVGSLKALRSAELAHWVAWGRGFLRVFDVLFVIGLILGLIGGLWFVINTHYQITQKLCQEARDLYAQTIEFFIDDLPDIVELDSEADSWALARLDRVKSNLFLYLQQGYDAQNRVFSFESFKTLELDEQLEILTELEKNIPAIEKKLQSDDPNEPRYNFALLQEKIAAIKTFKEGMDSVCFPTKKFAVFIIIATTITLLAAALLTFLYRLATILFRILFSAADLYAASFRDDFDPAANKRRDDLLASVETIKTNGAPVATQDANAV